MNISNSFKVPFGSLFKKKAKKKKKTYDNIDPRLPKSYPSVESERRIRHKENEKRNKINNTGDSTVKPDPLPEPRIPDPEIDEFGKSKWLCCC